MLARAEFHPLAGRVVGWLLALLRPDVRGELAPDDDGVLAQRTDLRVRQRGAQVSFACTQWVENRSPRALWVGWTLPRPFDTSAGAVEVRLGTLAMHGQIERRAIAEDDARRAWGDGRSALLLCQAGWGATSLAGGWLAPRATMEVRSEHRCAIDPCAQFADTALDVQMDGTRRLAPPCGIPIGRRMAGRGASRAQVPVPLSEAPAVLAGVLSRLSRRAAAGLALCSAARDRAILRGVLEGCAARILLAAPAAAEAAVPAPPAHDEVGRLLRTYREVSPAERSSLARQITDLGLRHGLVTPWTAVLAVGESTAAQVANA